MSGNCTTFNEAATHSGIAVAHSAFNIMCTLLLLPMSSLLEKLAYKLVPETEKKEVNVELDERFLATPSIAIDRCYVLTMEMAEAAVKSLKEAMQCLTAYKAELAQSVRELENKTDHYEDIIGTYLVKLSAHQISDHDSAVVSKILKMIGDWERISDHAVNLIDSAEELREKEISFSDGAKVELANLCDAMGEILDLSLSAFKDDDMEALESIEPLEEVIDELKERMRNEHIRRLKKGICKIETGFIWSDILTNLERSSDHCSNIAGYVMEAEQNQMNIHDSIRAMKKESANYQKQYGLYEAKYL